MSFRQHIPFLYVKIYSYQVILGFPFTLFSFQLFRALAYVHSIGVCHRYHSLLQDMTRLVAFRDIKPQNLLIDPDTGVLKLCDFGSAKYLIPGEPNVSYICSRYYRAPELIFGSTSYKNSIDVWSAGNLNSVLLLFLSHNHRNCLGRAYNWTSCVSWGGK